MIKKKLTLTLTVILLLSLLVGCANIDPDNNESYEQPESDFAGTSDVSLPDYNGFSDKITIATTDTSPFVAYEDTAGTLAVAIEERNRLLAEKYSVEIKTSYFTADEVLSDAASSTLSGIRFADLYCFTADLTMQLDAMGKLCDISTLPDRSDIVATVGKNNLIYGAKGTLSAVAHSSTLYQQSAECVFYNRAMIKSLGLVDPAVLYAEDKWTYDEFLRYSHTIAADIMNKGSIDYESDTFGFCAIDNTEGLSEVLWHMSGQKFMTEFGGDPMMPYDVTEQNVAVETLSTIYKDRSRYDQSGNKAADLFASGRSGMLIYKLDYCKALEDTEIEYGIVPLMGGRGYVGGDELVYSLGTTTDATYSSAVLLTLLKASGDMFEKALSDSYTLLYSRNNAMTVMIDHVIRSAGFGNELLLCNNDESYQNVFKEAITSAVTTGKKFVASEKE